MSVHRASRGIPRTISIVCDNAMLAGFAAGVKPVGSDLVEEVSRDFRLRPAGVPVASSWPPTSPSHRGHSWTSRQGEAAEPGGAPSHRQLRPGAAESSR